MLNFVTEPAGHPGAVLIRAVEPIEGVETMAKQRKVDLSHGSELKNLQKLTAGPAKLALAMGIDRQLNGKLLGLPHLSVHKGKSVQSKNIVTTTRVGISSAKELPLRFYVKDNPFVSQ